MRMLPFLVATSVVSLISCTKSPTQGTCQPGNQCHQWMVKPVDSKAAMQIIRKNPEISILDVRTPAEFAKGHIKGAINVDFKSPDFARNIAKLNKHVPYILHCRSGNRSGQSLEILKKNNFGTLYHLEGGFNEWQASGQPVERESNQDSTPAAAKE